ncbi:MAG: enoyl-CoA hydratase/isomerase family protein [Myxococcota bacterium]
MAEPAVLYEVANHVATLTLNRADNRNSMTADLLAGLAAAVAEVRADAGVRCVIITGRGRSFCAGADFRERRDDEADETFRAAHERSYATYSHFLSILDIEVPTIAAMQGHAIGGGLGLGVVCDLRVANAEARYGVNFVQLGLHPGMATTYLLPRLMGVPRAVEFLLTGRIVSGAEAAEAGLVHYAEEGDAVLARAQALAGEIAAGAPLAMRWTKEAIYEGLGWDPRTAARREAHLQSRSAETEDFREGVAALLERRPARFRGR